MEGRILDHCLRNALPYDLGLRLENSLRDLHRDALNHLSSFHRAINERNGFVIDLHTMASFSPTQNGDIKTFPESFDSLEDYCEQFISAPREDKKSKTF